MSRKRRVLVYAQHLSGVGHHVRSREIARALAATCEVSLLQGGRPVPGTPAGAFEQVELPALVRGSAGLEPLDRSKPLDATLAERIGILRDTAERLAPDVLLIEHYPFSKWELEPEIVSAIDAARRSNPALKVVCSLRDVCPKTRHESVDAEAYAGRVASTLNAYFDALLVHSDPSFTRLEEHFAEASRIEIPIEYTGFVSQKPASTRTAPGARGFAVVSTGGGARSADAVQRVAEAWRQLRSSGLVGERRLVIFPGLFWSREELERLRRRTRAGPFEVRAFADDFLSWLAAADLSISRAGYNTCTNLMETRTRAILVPDARMSDQGFRARRFAELGLARVTWPEDLGGPALAKIIRETLEGDPPQHQLDLSGAARACEIVSAL